MSTAKRSYSGARIGKERSTFAMTCNRLNLFLKEKGNLRDIGINANFDVKGMPEIPSLATKANKMTVDLLSKIECPVQTPEKRQKTDQSTKNLPRYVSVDAFLKQNDSTNKSVSSASNPPTESKTAKMTIFYKGNVLVFDHISADKARDMVLAATDASSNKQIPLVSTSNFTYKAFRSHDQILPRKVNGLDLPIARRASLHKFLAKRKDEARERDPYQSPNQLMAVASSSHKFDLNL